VFNSQNALGDQMSQGNMRTFLKKSYEYEPVLRMIRWNV